MSIVEIHVVDLGSDPARRRARAHAALADLVSRFMMDKQPASTAASLSHSGSVGLVALSDGPAVGVDLELLARRPPSAGLIERVLDPAAAALVLALAEPQRTRLFLAHWTAREAAVKALGTGFRGIEPAQVTIVDAAGSPRVRSGHAELDALTLRTLPLEQPPLAPLPHGATAVGCVAAPGPFELLVSGAAGTARASADPTSDR